VSVDFWLLVTSTPGAQILFEKKSCTTLPIKTITHADFNIHSNQTKFQKILLIRAWVTSGGQKWKFKTVERGHTSYFLQVALTRIILCKSIPKITFKLLCFFCDFFWNMYKFYFLAPGTLMSEMLSPSTYRLIFLATPIPYSCDGLLKLAWKVWSQNIEGADALALAMHIANRLV
jgi:hypothetical protein